MSHQTLCQSETIASLYLGWLASIEQHPSRWQWPTSTAQYLRFRLKELTGEMLASGADVAVQL